MNYTLSRPLSQVFQSAIESLSRRLPPSDTILVNLSLANLLTSLFRTVPIFVSGHVPGPGLVPPLLAAVGVVAGRGLLSDSAAHARSCGAPSTAT